ncbi:sensor domain-containing protein [Catenulispora sp. NF23]|uniref:sensor histidine kinase n=1 Tax=Catenulispora pinistramenti TaxID=2705254 RepID=UPI001BAB9421|nr:sensor histidine kinase [Catenulispora pinistramenti]MBS2534006.1 sensor domain-containing protein [Catenulispora pinistramenti]
MNAALASTGRFLLVPWQARAWRDLWFVVLSSALSLPPLGIMVLAWIFYVPAYVPSVLVCVFAPLAVVVLLSPQLTALRRATYFEIRGVRIPKPPPLPSASGGPRNPGRLTAVGSALADRFRSPRTWRQALFHLVACPAAELVGVLSGVAWLGALVFASVAGNFAAKGSFALAGVQLAVCLVLVYLAPWLVMASVRWDLKLAADLLGPTREEQLAQRVSDLTESRAATVDAADAERRRIERDLHDGTQQRLVSLAMNLGLARATLTDLPEDARAALAEAHEEAKDTLAELRHLVRGLHPVVLEDRGLDAALSGVAARSPVPVRLAVDVPRRVSPTVEAVAYFTVSEALANIAKHAQAAEARVDVWLDGPLLKVSVTDDGVGGADAGRGSGLNGLAQRAASVDGGFEFSSPVGGPTTIQVELPCEL